MKKFFLLLGFLLCMNVCASGGVDRVAQSDDLVPVEFNVPFVSNGNCYPGIGLYLPKQNWTLKSRIQTMVAGFYEHDFGDGSWTFYIDQHGDRCVKVQRRIPYRFNIKLLDSKK